MVAAIAVILLAIALPLIYNMAHTAHLRGQLSAVASLIQNCRSQAVQQNATKQLLFTTRGSSTVIYVDDLANPIGLTPSGTAVAPQQLWLPRDMQIAAPPSSSPAPLNSSTMWGDGLHQAANTTGPMCFNSQGLPCDCPSNVNASCPGGNASTYSGYLDYFTVTTGSGGEQWAAVGISRGGRIKTFFWNGTAWSD